MVRSVLSCFDGCCFFIDFTVGIGVLFTASFVLGRVRTHRPVVDVDLEDVFGDPSVERFCLGEIERARG